MRYPAGQGIVGTQLLRFYTYDDALVFQRHVHITVWALGYGSAQDQESEWAGDRQPRPVENDFRARDLATVGCHFFHVLFDGGDIHRGNGH